LKHINTEIPSNSKLQIVDGEEVYMEEMHWSCLYLILQYLMLVNSLELYHNSVCLLSSCLPYHVAIAKTLGCPTGLFV